MNMSSKTKALVLCVALTLTGCSSSEKSTQSTQPPSGPIEQMEVAFEGSHRKAEIKEALDKAFDAVGGDRDYSRAGSVLVAFRKKYGISEMDVLACMPYRANDSRAPKKNFGNVAAVCLTDLASEVDVP